MFLLQEAARDSSVRIGLPDRIGAEYPSALNKSKPLQAESDASDQHHRQRHHHHHHSHGQAHVSSKTAELHSDFLSSSLHGNTKPKSYDSHLRVHVKHGQKSAHILSTSSSEPLVRAGGDQQTEHNRKIKSNHQFCATDSTESEPIIPPERMKNTGKVRKRLSWKRRMHLKRLMMHNQAKALAQQGAIDLLFRTSLEEPIKSSRWNMLFYKSFSYT